MTFRNGTTIFLRYPNSTSKDTELSIGNSRANQIESALPELRWASEDRTVHTLTLAYPFLLPSQNNRSVLEVQCRMFKPREGKDILTDVWQKSDGTNQIVVFPPLACVSHVHHT
jgi:hypothetical protein